MSVYKGMSEADLEAEIAALRTRILEVSKSDTAGVKTIAGEGRRMEFFGPGSGTNLAELRRLLNDAEAQLLRLRGGAGSAIGVIFP